MLTPSIGSCVKPLTSFGALDAEHVIERRGDVVDVIELRARLLSALIFFGQETTSGLRVPPKCEATSLV